MREKNDNIILRAYNQIASDVWRYSNPVYKLMENNEQTATGVN